MRVRDGEIMISVVDSRAVSDDGVPGHGPLFFALLVPVGIGMILAVLLGDPPRFRTAVGGVVIGVGVVAYGAVDSRRLRG